MEFINLKAQYEALKKDIDEAVHTVLDNNNYILGKEVSLLEEELARYVGTKYCITCANGTDALSLAFDTLRIGKGDAVFLPNFTFFATAETVSRAGAMPVFVDVDADTFNIDTKKLEDAIAEIKKEGEYMPRAIISVDLFGLPCDYDKLKTIANAHNLFLIEDGAQGFGGEYKNKKACSFGDIATTSFFPAKPLGCYGDGGAIFTNNEEYAKKLMSLRFHGKGDDKYDNVDIGYNSRLDTIQAAVLRVKLRAFEDYEMSRRGESARLYDSLLKNIVKTPFIPSDYLSSYAQYTLTLDNEVQRQQLIEILKSDGIPSMVYYPKCMHEQTAYQTNPCKFFDVSVSQKLTKCVLSLPMHPYLTKAEIEKVSAAVKRGLK